MLTVQINARLIRTDNGVMVETPTASELLYLVTMVNLPYQLS